jgi:aspartate/methionine/tyrosine aminotransferase
MLGSSERAAALQASAVIGLQDLAAELLSQGHSLYPLVLGESDLPTPTHIVEAGRAALADGRTFYPAGRGDPELLETIAAKLRPENALDVDPERQLFVTNGSGLGLYFALLAMTEPGQEVIISDPTYGPFLDAIRLAGLTPVFAPLMPDKQGQWRWDPACTASAVTSRTAAVILTTPSAPHGSVLTETELRGLGELAVDRDLGLISDEVFEHFVFDGRRHLSIAALDPAFAERTVSVFSFSKSYSMTGWRLGYNVGPPQHIAAMERMLLAFGRPAAAFTQRAGIAALTGPKTFTQGLSATYAARRAQVETALSSVPGIRRLRPEGAFYIWLDFSSYGDDSRALAARLLREAHVALTPGTFYGPAGQGWLRLSFAGPVETTLAGVGALAETLSRW